MTAVVAVVVAPEAHDAGAPHHRRLARPFGQQAAEPQRILAPSLVRHRRDERLRALVARERFLGRHDEGSHRIAGVPRRPRAAIYGAPVELWVTFIAGGRS